MTNTKVMTLNDYKKPIPKDKFVKNILVTESEIATKDEEDEVLEHIGIELDRLNQQLIEEKGDKQGLLDSAKKLADTNKKNEHKIKELEEENNALKRENDKILNKRSEYSVKYKATREKLLKNQAEDMEELILKKAKESSKKYDKLFGI